MEESQPLQPADAGEESGNDTGANQEAEAEKERGIPFGITGITLLTNILQYSVLLGLTMAMLIIIRIFMRMNMMPTP